MDSSAQNQSNLPVSDPNLSQTNDDSIVNLQNQLTQLQNKKQQDEQQQIDTINQALQKPLSQLDDQIDSVPLSQQPAVQIQQDKLNKERRDQLVGAGSPERVPLREVQTEFEPPKELEQWMEKQPDPKAITLPKPVQDEYGDILIQASQVPRPNIVLPLDEEEVEKAFHHKVADSIRWLAEWCKRNILHYPKRVFYNKKNNQDNKETK